jgi:hypothetical protein
MIVMSMYAAAETAIHQTTTRKTVWLTLKRYMRRPEKKRKRERWIRDGNARTVK